ncbi:helix-turn-helix domain-containing protein [Delftia sp. HK171]|uniref:helix-turn-helix domain-containing protein n=1 Tax=Delftia sp. HK171 TaxID=1920191 RepID=UPI0009034FBA|nr:helix-turn-helix domain-containing protein [Delftia sp. HK171]
MNKAQTEILTVSDLAEILNCDAETVATRLISGDLPGTKIGRGWIIPTQALLERLNEKALDESAERRQERDITQYTLSTEIIKKPKNRYSKNPGITKNSSILTSNETNRGKKRREPPPLPRLESIVITN